MVGFSSIVQCRFSRPHVVGLLRSPSHVCDSLCMCFRCSFAGALILQSCDDSFDDETNNKPKHHQAPKRQPGPKDIRPKGQPGPKDDHGQKTTKPKRPASLKRPPGPKDNQAQSTTRPKRQRGLKCFRSPTGPLGPKNTTRPKRQTAPKRPPGPKDQPGQKTTRPKKTPGSRPPGPTANRHP